MFGYRFLSTAAAALGIYGVLGLLIAAAMIVVGNTTFGRVAGLQKTLESERVALVQSLQTVSSTLRDSAGATTNFQHSIDGARGSADQASKLANDTAGTFRDMGNQVKGLTVLGFQPLASLGPQFDTSADQLQQLAMALGATRESLAQNSADVLTVGGQLGRLQTQLDTLAGSLNQPGVLGLDAQGLVPFEVAFYGMCLLVILQSAFAIAAGVVLYRLGRTLGSEPLFPRRGSPPALSTPGTQAETDRLTLAR